MEVNKILKLCATMLQLKDLEDCMRNPEFISENDNADLTLLMDAVNLVCNTISTDYINLTKTKIVENKSGEISFAELGEDAIYKIIKVKNMFGERVLFKVTTTGIKCDTGKLSITYSYYPREYTYGEIIDVFKSEMSERVFAMGVVSEFLFIRGNADDASIWEDRFKNAMRNIVRHRQEVVLPKRRWW